MTDDSSHDWGRRTFLKATGAAGAAAAVGVTNVTAGRQPGPKENELVVGLLATASIETAEVEIEQTLPAEASVVHRNDSLGYLAVDVPESMSDQARTRVREMLEARGDVKFVEKNVTFEAHAVDDPRLDEQYAPQQVRATDAWEKTLGNENVEIGIIDSGVGWGHEDLQDQFGDNKGRDFAEGGDPPRSGDTHGTHVGGIASATTDNGVGTAGMSNSRLYSVRALGGSGRGSLTDIADAIDWSAQQGVDIINMSLGGGGRTELLKNAVSNAYSSGVLIFASAGNSGPGGDSVAYPAKYEECIAVSALNDSEDIARFSSRGPEVEITGPGASVLSTVPGDSYRELSGTSMSSPAVTGVAALGLEWAAEQGVEYSNDEMRGLVKETARDVGLSGNEQGSGCANANALLEAIGPGPNELTFEDQLLGDDGAVTVSDVQSSQASTIAVTYADGDQNIIAGLAAADNLGGEDVEVAIEDAGGFPGEHTAWLFDDNDVPDGVGIGDDATPIAGDALDSDSANVTEPEEGLTFEDQFLGDDGAVTVSDVVSNQPSTIAVTYADGDQNIIAGLAAADDLDGAEVDVAIEDAGGFPGEHTAWLFDDNDVPDGVGIGDDATPIAGDAIASDSAEVTEPEEGLTFEDQILGDDGAVTVTQVVSNQPSTIAVTYADGDQNIIAGLAAADDLDGAEVEVAIEDAGGFPGEHTAWLFDDNDVPEGVGIGDDATPIAGDALDSDSANVTDEPEGPEAVITASTTEPSVGQEVELDGTDSSSPNGEITEYAWSAEPGGSVTGPTAVLVRDEAVSVDVTLEVTDEAGETASTTQTFEFSDDGGNCGEESEGGSADGFIIWWNNSDRYSYSLRTDDPCQLTIDLDGPSGADFDLYVTLDGRRPTPDDFDRSSETPNADEQIIIDDPSDVSEVGILVQGVSGYGRYTISAEELSF